MAQAPTNKPTELGRSRGGAPMTPFEEAMHKHHENNEKKIVTKVKKAFTKDKTKDIRKEKDIQEQQNLFLQIEKQLAEERQNEIRHPTNLKDLIEGHLRGERFANSLWNALHRFAEKRFVTDSFDFLKEVAKQRAIWQGNENGADYGQAMTDLYNDYVSPEAEKQINLKYKETVRLRGLASSNPPFTTPAGQYRRFGEIWDDTETEILTFITTDVYPNLFHQSDIFKNWVDSGGKKEEEKKEEEKQGNPAMSDYANYYMDTDLPIIHHQQNLHTNHWNNYLQSRYDYESRLSLPALNEPIQSSQSQNWMDAELLIFCALSFVFLFAVCMAAFALCLIYNFFVFRIYKKTNPDINTALDSLECV